MTENRPAAAIVILTVSSMFLVRIIKGASFAMVHTLIDIGWGGGEGGAQRKEPLRGTKILFLTQKITSSTLFFLAIYLL